jgi:hypothetical protein
MPGSAGSPGPGDRSEVAAGCQQILQVDQVGWFLFWLGVLGVDLSCETTQAPALNMIRLSFLQRGDLGA